KERNTAGRMQRRGRWAERRGALHRVTLRAQVLDPSVELRRVEGEPCAKSRGLVQPDREAETLEPNARIRRRRLVGDREAERRPEALGILDRARRDAKLGEAP